MNVKNDSKDLHNTHKSAAELGTPLARLLYKVVIFFSKKYLLYCCSTIINNIIVGTDGTFKKVLLKVLRIVTNILTWHGS